MLSSMEHERMEKKILCMLTERNTKLKPTALPEEDSDGMMFSPNYGNLVASRDVMMIVSVGSKHSPGVRVEERVRDKARATRVFEMYGKLPRLIVSLQISRETVADLKVVSSHVQKSATTRDVSLKLDIPNMQRPKEYYITAIANFLKQCRQPGGMYTLVSMCCWQQHFMHIVETVLLATKQFRYSIAGHTYNHLQ